MSKGRINPEDITMVREKINIEDIISEKVTLKRVGSNLSGLCPFHDDSSPSFTVSPSRGLWTCFGCGLGGDVISYVQQSEGLPFVEAIQLLAEKAGITLRYTDTDANFVPPPPGQRRKLIQAHEIANQFYMETFKTPTEENQVGRDYLNERNFNEETWEEFSIGWAPNSYDALLKKLKSEGFTEEEIILSGLAVQNEDGKVYDRFRGRLTWAIRDVSGDIVGFGARKLREDDKGPKWLNTPDTPIYHKSEILYGIDAARKNIAAEKQIVIVEGYGDVMAAHLSGVKTAVATCGTAFGEGHIRIARRLLRDDEASTGKVIFTFDGDAAGQKAAMRAFKENNRFTAQTFVAVAPENMDPCDLRLHKGEQAVRDLIDSAVPLVEFVIKTILNDYNLSSTEGRVAALKAVSPIAADIKDATMRAEYVRRLSGWLALPSHSVQSAVNIAVKQLRTGETVSDGRTGAPTESSGVNQDWRPNPTDPILSGEREAAKCFLQAPVESRTWIETIDPDAFTTKAYRGILILAARIIQNETNLDDATFLHNIREKASEDENVSKFVNELALEPLHSGVSDVSKYVKETMTRLIDKFLERQIIDLKASLSEVDAETQGEVLRKIMDVETRRRVLKSS